MESFYVDGARQLNAIGNVIRIEYVNLVRDGDQIKISPSFEVVMTLQNFERFRSSINELWDKMVFDAGDGVAEEKPSQVEDNVVVVKDKKQVRKKK